MPPPFFILALIIIVLAFAGYMGVKGIELEKLKLISKQKPDNSLGLTELKGLIQQAVEEANAPLHERIRELEAHVTEQKALPPARRPKQLNPADEEVGHS